MTNSVGRLRNRRTVWAGRETDGQCGQAENMTNSAGRQIDEQCGQAEKMTNSMGRQRDTETDSVGRLANSSGQVERQADSISIGNAGRQAMSDEQHGQADR